MNTKNIILLRCVYKKTYNLLAEGKKTKLKVI